MSVKAKLLELRATAERLPLGEHGDRCLRDLFIEFVDALTGNDEPHESLALVSARAPAPAPERVGVVAVQLSAPAGSARDMIAPALDVPDPAGADWLAAQMAADAKAEAEAAAAAKAPPPKKNDQKATPTPNGGH